MSLDKFKLLKEDDDSYHLESPSGKSLMVKKAELNDNAHAVIKKMKAGGMVGGDGTVPDAPDGYDQMTATPKDLPGGNQSQGQDKPWLQNAWDSLTSGSVLPNVSFTPDQKSKIDTQDAAASAPQSAISAPAPVSQSTVSQSPVMAPAPALNMSAFTAPYAKEKAANLEMAGDIGKQYEEENAAIKSGLAEVNKLPSQIDIVNGNKSKQDALSQAFMDKKVDPNRLWHNMSTGNKALATVSLILGGIGSAFTGKNQAMEILDNAVNRDIDAQKNDQGKAMNQWKMNREALGDDLSATLATQNQKYVALKYQIDQAANKYQGPLALARAKMANAQIDQKMAANNATLAFINGAPGSEQNYTAQLNQMRMINPDVAKEAQEKLVPGVGLASVKPSEQDKTEITNYKNINDLLEKARAFQTTGPGANIGAWSPAHRREAMEIQSQLINNLDQLGDIKRMSPDMVGRYKGMVGNPGSFDLFGSNAAGMKELQGDVQAKSKNLQTSLGIKPFAKAPINQQAVMWAKQNPNDPRSTLIMQRNSGAR